MKRLAKLLIAAFIFPAIVAIPSQGATASINLASSKANDNSIFLKWVPSNISKSSTFEVLYTEVATKYSKSIFTKLNYVNIKNLKILTKYSVKVFAISNKKRATSSKTFTLITSEPGVKEVQVTENSATNATVTWLAQGSYSSYKIRLDNAVVYESKENKFVLTNLKPGILHTVEVAGVSGSTTGSFSDPVEFLLDSSGPATLTATKVTTSGFTITWSPVTDATEYRIYKDSVLVDTVKTLTYSFSGLLPGATTVIEVSGLVGSFETDKTGQKLNTLVDTPAAPTAVSTGATSVVVSWVKDSNATGYTINLNDAAGTFLKSYSASVSATSYTITGLSPLTPYTVNISYVYGANSSKPSANTSFTPIKEIPSGLVASAITRTTFTLSWNQIPGISGYEVYRDNSLVIQLTDPTTTTYSVTGSPGVTYAMTVKARMLDSAKVIVLSDPSAILNVTMLGDPAYAVTSSSAPVITLPYATVPIIGATITSSVGSWTGTPQPSSYTYQWQRTLDNGTTWTDISGATSSSYAVTESDHQFKLRVKVSAINTNGTGIGYSVKTDAVEAVYNTALPLVRGTTVIGQILDCTTGSWSSQYGINYAYKWYRNGSAISGATTSAYTLVNADVATTTTCTVEAITKLGSAYATSPARNNVQAVINTVLPVVSGTIRVASALSVTNGTWLNSPTYEYQWQRSSDNILWDSISGANSSTYTLTASEAGYYVRAVVYGVKTISSTDYKVSASSSSTLVPNPSYTITNTVAPTVSGSWTSGQTLTANNGSWSATGTFTYQWQSSSDNSTFTDIAGATSKTYVLTNTETGNFVRVRVYNTTSSGDGVAYSIATSKVGAPYCTVNPAITSSLRIGNTQSVTTGTWDNTPTSYTYQWQSSTNGIAWSNADTGTASSYIATFDVANKYIRVLVTATNATGSTTVTIGNISGFLPPVATEIPVISGTVSGTNTLTTSTGTWPSMNGQTPYEYQWQRSSDNGATWSNISGAMSSTYALVAADQGYIIRSQVSVRTNSGTSTSYSIPTAAVG